MIHKKSGPPSNIDNYRKMIQFAIAKKEEEKNQKYLVTNLWEPLILEHMTICF